MRGLALIAAAVAALGSACAATAGGYRVRPGDTLTAIAQNHGMSVAVLERLNRLAPGDTLLAGSVLRLPRAAGAVQRYTVRPGETLTGIAARYGTTAGAIARASGRQVEQTLVIGTVLNVPGAKQTAIPARAEVSTTRPGDSLSAIAMRYGVSLGALAALNHLRLERPLWVGVRLKLPAQTLAHATGAFDRSTVRGSLVYWANHYGVDPRLATALAWMESGFNNSLVSPVGAVGVMQITPDTWDYVEQVLLLGQQVPHDADGNVRVGVAFLAHLLRQFDGDERLALAAYYRGPAAVRRYGVGPETRRYVANVLALRSRM